MHRSQPSAGCWCHIPQQVGGTLHSEFAVKDGKVKADAHVQTPLRRIRTRDSFVVTLVKMFLFIL